MSLQDYIDDEARREAWWASPAGRRETARFAGPIPKRGAPKLPVKSSGKVKTRCQQCLKPFETSRAIFESRPAKYCSRACTHDARRHPQ